MIGTWTDDTTGAYLFDATSGALLQTFSDPNPTGDDTFGRSLAMDGNRIVFGDYGDATQGNLVGQAYLFTAAASPDFNSDGLLDCVDIDGLVAQIVAGTNNYSFDVTGDGVVDHADLDEWLVQAGAANLLSGNPYLVGDANLNGTVDGLDFIAWNDNKFTSTAAWCSGDFNADGLVDGLDFVLWNDNKYTSSDGVNAVPEPGAGVLLFAAVLCLGVMRRRR